MCRLLYGALSAMTPGSTSPAAASDGSDRESLLPRTGALELFVTMTDARGHRRYIPIGNRLVGGEPLVVSDLTHRHVARFALDRRRGKDHFAGGANDAALGFRGPGDLQLPGSVPADQPGRLHAGDRPARVAGCRDRSSGSSSAPTNSPGRERATPISSTVGCWTTSRSSMPSGRSRAGRPPVRSSAGWSMSNRTRAGRPASRAAPRRQRPRPPRQPGWLDTILAGLSSIPAKEPIVDDLARVRAFNERVAYIADLTQTNYPQVEAALLETDAGPARAASSARPTSARS